ncbi:MAG: cytochrome c nitrite reductase small subunit [Myxococcota bacterium]
MRWLPLLCTAAFGVLAGMGIVTFVYAEGFSYLSTDPTACVNCHIMQSQYDSWQKASHHTAARCVDCHLPHDFVPKYIGKAEHGWNHSVGFTLQNFHEPIQISRRSAEQLQGNCLRCHGELLHSQLDPVRGAPRCVHCHADVGHGETAGLGGPLERGR